MAESAPDLEKISEHKLILRNSLSSDRGIAAIPNIAKGIYEQQEPIYSLKESSEEQKLFEINESIRDIIEGLENHSTKMEQKDEEKA